VLGRYYGADREYLTIKILDKDFNELARFGPYWYSQYFTGDREWATIQLPRTVRVEGDFYVVINTWSTSPDAPSPHGVFICYDADSFSLRSYLVDPITNALREWIINRPRQQTDWMIRVVGHSPA